MKRMLLVGAGFIAVASLLGTTPPAEAAASQKVRRACEKQANLVRPALRADEREAFIANCLANNTPTPRRKY